MNGKLQLPWWLSPIVEGGAYVAALWLYNHHVIGPQDNQNAVGTICFLAAMAWSAWNNRAYLFTTPPQPKGPTQ